MAAYAAKAGLPAHVFMPQDTPSAFIIECHAHGAQVSLVDGLITDCGRIVAERQAAAGWFDVSTLKEPYRVEGKKTMGYELAEQLGWSLPDVILYPAGGGTGLIGMWKAFAEMQELGWIGVHRPRMIAVQADGCQPIVRAYEQHLDDAPEWENAHTLASGLRVPRAVGDFLMLQAIHGRSTRAVAVRLLSPLRHWWRGCGRVAPAKAFLPPRKEARCSLPYNDCSTTVVSSNRNVSSCSIPVAAISMLITCTVLRA
jgi:threonine synthase